MAEIIEPKDCKNKDCHLKCSQAKVCMVCGKRRKQADDWRLYIYGPTVLIGLTLFYLALSSGYYGVEPYKSQNITPIKFFLIYSICLLVGIAAPILFIFYIFFKNLKSSRRVRCCYENCDADLRSKGCKKCGHPPHPVPYIFFHFAAAVALPSAAYGACMYSQPEIAGLTSALGNLGIIISATAILAGLIGLILRER